MTEPRSARRLSSRNTRRGITATAGAVALSGVFLTGWLVAGAFESPAQKEAAASPPPSGPVLAHVERGNLEQSFTATATVGAESRSAVAVPAAEGGGYVTAQFLRPDDTVASGRLVLEVNSAPVLALPGDFPFYRDLAVGDTGRDVRQLQQGLRAAGLSVSVDGRFGAGTADAVATLYRRVGYAVPTREASESLVPSPPAAAAEPAEPDGGPAAAPSPPPQPFVPAADLMAFRTLPATVVSTPAVGSAVGEDTTVTVEFGDLVASGSVPSSVAGVAKTNLNGTAEHSGTTVPIIVKSETSAQDKESAGIVAVPAAGSSFPAEWTRQRVLLSVVVARSAENALLVPSRAVVTDSRGGGTLLVKAADGSFRHVKVHEQAELDGKSAVEPVSGDKLSVGDQVRVD